MESKPALSITGHRSDMSRAKFNDSEISIKTLDITKEYCRGLRLWSRREDTRRTTYHFEKERNPGEP